MGEVFMDLGLKIGNGISAKQKNNLFRIQPPGVKINEFSSLDDTQIKECLL